mgnify:CR=1 FL=1
MLKKLFAMRKDFENPDLVEEFEEEVSANEFAAKNSEVAYMEEDKMVLNGKITKDSTIGDVVQEHPEIIETLTSLGVHCVGCHVSPFETLEMGFKGHGMSDEDVDEAVIKLNQAIEDSKNENSVFDEEVHLTRNAAEKIKTLSKGNGGLRVYVERGGCSGYTYEMKIVEDKKEDDLEFEDKGVKVFIEKNSFEKLKGSYIDYLDTLQGAGFKIKNPNANTTCGCGESFG